MGRIFEKRKVRMFARWAKTAKAFTKVGKEIAIAVKLGGADPDSNPRLRMAMQTGRSLNMPKDRIEAAIKRAAGKDSADLIEINYSAYAPHGIALLISAATDNPTRTVANVRSILTSHSGSMASSGALDYLFTHRGVFRIKKDLTLTQEKVDQLELALIDFGLEELLQEEDEIAIVCGFKDFGTIQKELESHKLELISAGLEWQPATTNALEQVKENQVRELIDALEEDDDVQHVFHNLAQPESEEFQG
jgi:YebC/PmpR family DNA-binding regulatory protein